MGFRDRLIKLAAEVSEVNKNESPAVPPGIQLAQAAQDDLFGLSPVMNTIFLERVARITSTVQRLKTSDPANWIAFRARLLDLQPGQKRIDLDASNPIVGNLVDQLELLDRDFLKGQKPGGQIPKESFPLSEKFAKLTGFLKPGQNELLPVIGHMLDRFRDTIGEREQRINAAVKTMPTPIVGPKFDKLTRMDYQPMHENGLDRPLPGLGLGRPSSFNTVKTRPTKPSDIKFSIMRKQLFRITDPSQLMRSTAAGGISDALVRTGVYIFTYKMAGSGTHTRSLLDNPAPFKVHGKNQTLEKAVFDPTTGTLKLQVKVRENFVLIASLSIAALLAGGFAAKEFSGSLKQVDQVIVDTTKGSTKLAIAMVIGSVAIFVIPKLAPGIAKKFGG